MRMSGNYQREWRVRALFGSYGIVFSLFPLSLFFCRRLCRLEDIIKALRGGIAASCRIIPMILSGLLTAVMTSLAAHAGGWRGAWICHPAASPDEQVWFRRTFTDSGHIIRAQVEVAACGMAVLYVNGYNVSADVPDAAAADTVRLVRYDVTRFLRPDTNVVAVWYSPYGTGTAADDVMKVKADSMTEEPGGRSGQLSLTFFGSRIRAGGVQAEPFSHVSDATWLCRTNGGRTVSRSREVSDGRELTVPWNGRDMSVMQWVGAERPQVPCNPVVVDMLPLHSVMRVTHIYDFSLLSATPQGLVYGCVPGFRGRLRMTLRDMRRGDVVSVGGMQYICSGETDEQAYMRFTDYEGDDVTVSGSVGLSETTVMAVEGLVVEPCCR